MSLVNHHRLVLQLKYRRESIAYPDEVKLGGRNLRLYLHGEVAYIGTTSGRIELIASSLKIRLVSFVSVISSICLASCGGSAATPTASPSPRSGIQHAGLTIDGHKRTYRLYIPPSIDPHIPAPLVVKLHGCLPGANEDGDAVATHFDDEATAGRFIAVYPDGVFGCWNDGSCCSNVDDVTFISRLLDRLIADLPINKTHVFVAGVSGGAFMAYRLACELSTRITAIASVSGAMLFDDCHPARPVSILEMHGTEDFYEGGGPANTPSVAAVIQHWTMLDGCVGDPIQSQTGITKTSVWKDCKGGAIVRLDAVVGGHHTWFGSNFDPIPGEPNANAVIWSFFSGLGPTG